MSVNQDTNVSFNPKTARGIEGESAGYNHTNPELAEYGNLAKYNIYISDGKVYFKSNYLRLILSETPSLTTNIDFYPFNKNSPTEENKNLIIAMAYASLRNFIYAYENNEFGIKIDPDFILTNITNVIQARFSMNFGFEISIGGGEYTTDKKIVKEMNPSDTVIARATISGIQEKINSSKDNPVFQKILNGFKIIKE